MAHITPTIGRIVLVRIPPDMHCAQIADAQGITTHAAKVAHVNEDGTLNLAAVDSDGNPYALQRVPLIQEGQVYTGNGPFAHWMPYQVGQAKRDAAKLVGDGGMND